MIYSIYIHVYTWYKHGIDIVPECMYLIISDIQICYVQDSILVVPPYPYCIEEVSQDVAWKTVGMLVSSFSLPATCVQRVGDPQRMHPTDAALMTSITT